ncbi:MAG: hypothetical protein ACR2J8_06105 [Thermomicrobiales bacterium]
MDHAAFDGLARRLASRRGALRTLAALFALPAAAATSASAAGCAREGKPCGGKRRISCCENSRCRKGFCVCKPGYAACDQSRRCLDLGASRQHCGACGAACSANDVCVSGICCATGSTICNGACCGSGKSCVPEHDGKPAICCPDNQVFVLCPHANIVLDPATNSSYCDMSPADLAALPSTCCPNAAICSSDGICCLDPDTQQAITCTANETCSTYGNMAASYVPPVKGRN